MGALAKLLGFVAIVAATYVLVSTGLSSTDFLVQYLGLHPAGAAYSSLFGDALAVLLALCALTLFTIPATLAMFGHGGAWLRHVVAKSAKGLGASLGAAFLLYIGTVAVSTARPDQVLSSAIEPVAIIGLSGVLVMSLLSSGTLLRGAEELVGAALRLASGLPSPRNSESTAVVELQLASTRRLREKHEEAVERDEALRFQRFARNLASLGCTAEFRLSFRGRRGRVLLLARGRESPTSLERRLLAVARTYLPEARPAPATTTCGSSPMASVLLSGPPEAAPNPLEPLARFFIENGHEGDYSVLLRSHRGNPVSSVIARRAQRRLARDSAAQRSTQSLTGDETSKTEQDQSVNLELEEAVKEVERRSSPQAVETWVYVTGVGSTADEALRVADSASMVVRASLSSHRRESELKARRQRKPFRDLRPSGKPSVMLPSEAAPLVWIPQMAIGIEVAPTTEFELPPPLEGEIELGEVMLSSGGSGHLARLPLDDLARHLYLGGMTGSGKTTTSFGVLIQLHNYGVPFLVIEPVKTEYRSLAPCIQGLQVFTPGEEEVAPFRLNIFEPPAGVSIKAHIDSLEACWNSSFTQYAPLPYVIKDILAATYRHRGWDIDGNRRGRPVTLEDFQVNAQRVIRGLGYEPKIIMDIEAAMKVRINHLSLGGKGKLFDCTASTPLETILRRPTVIELKGIPNDEEKAFVAALLLSNLSEYLDAKGHFKGLRHVTVVEEAHRLLPNVSTAKGDPEASDPRKRMVDQFANMLAEVRAYGEGLVIVEQIPTKILPDAIKNTATKIAHRVPAADDRDVLAGAMGMTEEQSQVLTALKPGEAVIHIAKHPLPIRVMVPDRAAGLGISVGEMGAADVRRLMAEFYQKNPQPPEPAALLRERTRKAVDNEAFRDKFLLGFREFLERHRPDRLVQLVAATARGLTDDPVGFNEAVLDVLKAATKFYLVLDEADRERFPKEVAAYMERSGRDRRG